MHSISRRLAVRFSAAAIIVFTLVGLGLTVFLRGQLDAGLQDSLEARAGIARLLISHTSTATEWPSVKKKIDNIIPAERNIGFYVLTPDPVFSYQTMPEHPIPNDMDRYERVREGGQSFLARKYLLPGVGARPDLVLVGYVNCRPVDRTTYAFVLALAITFLIASVVISASGYTVSRIGLMPLKRLSDEAAVLQPNRRDQRLQASNLPVELLLLKSSFNGALERIDGAQARLERFNADVAHELRTPIANIIGQAQVALTRDRSREALLNVIQSALEEGERMRIMVNDMLFLARADQGEQATELTPISIAVEVAHTLEFLDVPFEEAGVRATVSGDAHTLANKSLLRRALFNLLVNASQHASPGTQVKVMITQNASAIEVSVANEGIPISLAVLERLFDRFYRGVASRTTIHGNHGLGLSIVKAIAEMHRGTAFARCAHGWNEFGFTLPSSSFYEQ
ncbi:heavy metal sensor histidine kinase [Trinickia mobilis]|uniref:heavy metal sensor histidine kinase n=1 Tax=Trinickia mobilis TaxID=2816356 RepID=UPI001F5D76DC|nr:heavy metal sensor histidine kinase [Trinickia mobilis]